MRKIFEVNPEKLRFLLDSIQNRELALPDFQRDFVWDPRATELLIESIMNNYPAGSLLRMRNSKSFPFTPREFEGAPNLDGRPPSYLILDGQQRLTSLFQAFYGVGNHRYFVNFEMLAAPTDLDDCVFYLRKRDADRKYGNLQKQAATLTFPLEKLFGAPGGFEEWLDQVLDVRSDTEDQKKELKRSLRALKREWIEMSRDTSSPP